MIEKILLLCLIVNINGQQQSPQPSANGQNSWIFDLPPLNLQPLQLRLNPSTQAADTPALLLIKQNESIPVSSLLSAQNPQWAQQNQQVQWPQQPQWAQQAQWAQAQPALAPGQVQTQWPKQNNLFQLQPLQQISSLPQIAAQSVQQVQPIQSQEATKPLVPLAFQPPTLQPLTQPLPQSIAPLAGQQWQTSRPSTISKLPNWASNFKAQSPSLATSKAQPQFLQMYASLNPAQTQLSQSAFQQNTAVQQNTQNLNRNLPKESNMNTVLKSLSAYTPNQLPAQSVLFSQLPAQSVVGQQITPQVTDKNTQYFPTVTLPAINLPANELPVKMLDLSQWIQLNQQTTNSISNTATQKNPDRSTWTADEATQAAALTPEAASAAIQPRSLSSFPSLQTSAWSNPSPLQAMVAAQQQRQALAVEQEAKLDAEQKFIQRAKKQVHLQDQRQAQQQFQLQDQSHNQQQAQQQTQNQWQARLQAQQQAENQALQKAIQNAQSTSAVQRPQPYLSAQLQPWSPSSQPPVSPPLQPLSIPSPLQGLRALPPQQLKPSTASIQPLSTIKPVQPWSSGSPQQLPILKPFSASDLSKSTPGSLQPLSNLIPSQLPSPLHLSPQTLPSIQTLPTPIGTPQKLPAMKPLSFQSAPFQNVPSMKWSNSSPAKQSLFPKLQSLPTQTKPKLIAHQNAPKKFNALPSMKQTWPKSNGQQWTATTQNSNGIGGTGQHLLANQQASSTQFGARLGQAQFDNHFKKAN